MERNRKQWLLTGILWGLCACILISMFFTFFRLDIKSVVSGSFPESSDWLNANALLGGVGNAELFRISGLKVLTSLFKTDSSLGEAGNHWAVFMRVMILVPWGAAIATAILIFFKKRWGYLTSAIASAATCVFELLSTFLFVPSILSAEIAAGAGQLVAGAISSEATESAIGQAAADVVGSIVDSGVSGTVTPAVIRKMILKGIGPAWYLTVLPLAAAAAVAIYMFFVFGSQAEAAQAVEEPAMVCSAGPLPGIPISFRGSEEIIIGSSPAEANYILGERDCSPRHCSVRYESASGRYVLTVYGNSYVTLKNESFGAGPHYVDRGSVLQIGYGSCTLTLI